MMSTWQGYGEDLMRQITHIKCSASCWGQSEHFFLLLWLLHIIVLLYISVYYYIREERVSMSKKMRKDATAEMTSEVGLWRGEVFSQAKRNGFSSRENDVHKSPVAWGYTRRFYKRRGSLEPVGPRGGSAFACLDMQPGFCPGTGSHWKLLIKGLAPSEQPLMKLGCAEKSSHRKPRVRTRGIVPWEHSRLDPVPWRRAQDGQIREMAL